jgi:hypothetical protein
MPISPAARHDPSGGGARAIELMLSRPAVWAIPLSIALLWARRPLQFRRPQLWAEDGPIFFQQAYLDATGSLVTRYFGYHHLVPRLVAFVARAVPIAWVPAIYALASGTLTIALVAYALSRRMPFSPSIRVALALAAIAAPVATEVFLNLTNVQWFLALGLLLLGISVSPRTRLQRVFDISLLLVAGLTGPFALLFVPCFAIRWWARRDGHSVVLLALLVACAGIQFRPFGLELLRARAGAPTAHAAHLLDFIPVLGGRVYSILLGFLPAPSRSLMVVAFLFALAGAALVVARIVHRRAVEAMMVLLGGAAVLGSACAAFQSNPGALASGGDRYFYLPTVTILWAALLATRPPSRISLLLLILAAASFIGLAVRGEKMPDLHWSEASRCIGVRVPCIVPINPPGWQIELR